MGNFRCFWKSNEETGRKAPAGTEKTAAPKGGRLKRGGICWGQALSAAAAAAVVVAAAAIAAAAPAAAAAAADQQNEDDDPAAVPAEEAVITHTGTSYGVCRPGNRPHFIVCSQRERVSAQSLGADEGPALPGLRRGEDALGDEGIGEGVHGAGDGGVQRAEREVDQLRAEEGDLR